MHQIEHHARQARYTLRMLKRNPVLLLVALFALSPDADGVSQITTSPGGGASEGCLASGNGFLRAKVRGDRNLDINWRNAELECDGSPRPDGSGIRVSFAGPLQPNGKRVRMVFGVTSAEEGRSGRALPTNLTVIFEGEQRLFATRGDDKCTVDELRQERVGELGGKIRSYRVIARGFCISPASTLDGKERILMSRFDFAGRVRFEDEDPPLPRQAKPLEIEGQTI